MSRDNARYWQAASPVVRYELPFPPSTNNLFANAKKGRRRTDSYNAWRDTAGKLIQVQGRKRVHGFVGLAVDLVKPDRRKRDLSNTLKAIEDLLVDMQVIDDDSLIQCLSVQWVAEGVPCVVSVTGLSSGVEMERALA